MKKMKNVWTTKKDQDTIVYPDTMTIVYPDTILKNNKNKI